MTIKRLITALVFASVFVSTQIFAASDFASAKKAAIAEIDKAKAMGYEWRDSRKMIKKAEKAEKAGEHEKALKMLSKAERQGKQAVVQAKLQAKRVY